jgi:SAM-dependent methyltransferase
MSGYAAERRFASTVDLYRRFRPRYPLTFIAALAKELGLKAKDTVLDLGCGPGFLAIALRPFVGRVVAMDPEPLMIEAATAEAEAAGVPIEPQLGGSEMLPAGLDGLRAVVMGRSFHWMDRQETLRQLDPMVLPDGALAFCRSSSARRKAAWEAAVDEIKGTYGEDPGHPGTRNGHDHRAVLERSAFCRLSRLVAVERQSLGIEDVVGEILTKSSTSPARLGARRAALEAELARRLEAFLIDGRLERSLTFEALIARRG